MATVELHAKLLRWGNSYGLRIARGDVERLRLQPGDDVAIRMELPGSSMRITDIPLLRLGGTAADDHDDLFADSA